MLIFDELTISGEFSGASSGWMSIPVNFMLTHLTISGASGVNLANLVNFLVHLCSVWMSIPAEFPLTPLSPAANKRADKLLPTNAWTNKQTNKQINYHAQQTNRQTTMSLFYHLLLTPVNSLTFWNQETLQLIKTKSRRHWT